MRLAAVVALTMLVAVPSLAGVTLTVERDEAVCRGSEYDNVNLHPYTYDPNDTGLHVGSWSSMDEIARSYLAFDLSPLDGQPSVVDARMYVYLKELMGTGAEPIDAYLAGDSWTETTITWNNAPPPVGAALDSNGGPFAGGQWFSWDVTSAVVSQLAGDKALTVVLREENESFSIHSWKYFVEEEHTTTNKAYLDVTCAPGLPAFALVGAVPIIGCVARKLRRR